MNVEQWLGETNNLGIDIWNGKYKFENESFEQWVDRISGGNEAIKKLIKERKFLFGGRILASRGLQNKGRKITFSNCYVIEPPEDNIESIFDCAKKLARTYSYGGGCGIDISKLSPKNAKINNAAKETSGSVSFMDLYSMVTALIGQSGRRGALMISLDCSHPDIEEFINVKSDLNKITKANISVRITDKFMLAVDTNSDWELTYTRVETGEMISKNVSAKALFMSLAKMNWDYAEPGALFWDNITSWNLLSEDDNFKYAGVNPCAEEPLPAGGSCLLGSHNLSEFVSNPFTPKAKFELDKFILAVEQGVIALNEVLHEGLPLHPLQEQRDSVNDWRQIGLGVFGWHDTLLKMGIKYGEESSLDFAETIAFNMINTAIKTSANLTDVYGTYPKYNKSAIFKSQFFISNTSIETKTLVLEKGLANSQLLTIAPTGSIGTMFGVSTGLEPIYNISYTRKTESLHGKDQYYKVYTPIVEQYMKVNNITNEEDLPDFFNTAMTLNYKERIKMQAVWQSHIDASISSTVNVPNDFSVEEVEDLYMLAWKYNLKGITIFRDGCARTGILTNIETPKVNQPIELPWGTILDATDDLIGKKKKVISGCGSLHVQAWFDPINGKLMEVFLSKGGSGGCASYMVGLSRILSLALRTGASFDYVIDQLQSVPACPSYVGRTMTKKDTSKGSNCPNAVGYALIEMQKQVFDELGITEDVVIEIPVVKTQSIPQEVVKIADDSDNKCPECGEKLRFEGGCMSCTCGWSRCS